MVWIEFIRHGHPHGDTSFTMVLYLGHLGESLPSVVNHQGLKWNRIFMKRSYRGGDSRNWFLLENTQFLPRCLAPWLLKYCSRPCIVRLFRGPPVEDAAIFRTDLTSSTMILILVFVPSERKFSTTAWCHISLNDLSRFGEAGVISMHWVSLMCYLLQ